MHKGNAHTRNRSRIGRHAGVLIALALGALALPAPAGAALPARGADLQAHDHETDGANWHVQLMISSKNAQVVETLIFYAEVCGKTILKTQVAISDAGVVTARGRLKGGGRWRVDAAFTAPDTAVGTARLTRKACDTGPVAFKALTDEALEHAHGPLYPDIASATTHELRQAQAMRRRAWQASRELFPTYAAALARGFTPSPYLRIEPQIFHLRNLRNATDRFIFNSRRPEALVYWWQASGEHVLIGFMFRVPDGDRPPFAGPIPIYHRHFGVKTTEPMAHVWLTNDLRTAWANCTPVADLEQAHVGFRFPPPSSGLVLSGLFCPA